MTVTHTNLYTRRCSVRNILSKKDCQKVYRIMYGLPVSDIENLLDSKLSDIEDAVRAYPSLSFIFQKSNRV